MLCREYLLAVLLHLTLELLRGYPPHDRESSLAASLAAMLLKVCSVRSYTGSTASMDLCGLSPDSFGVLPASIDGD